MKSLTIGFVLFSHFIFAQSNFIEEFNKKGLPMQGGDWSYKTDIYPKQDGWKKICPGDGYAYLTVDSDVSNDHDETNPYQTITVNNVGPGHRMEVKMKGIAVQGLVGFIFTYEESNEIFNEIDIEIVPDDAKTLPENHDIDSVNGWTDARFNSWGNASVSTETPYDGAFKAIVNESGKKISLIDDKFHIFTIDWYKDKIDFYIDGVPQHSITKAVASNASDIILGFRDLAWAGEMKWQGTKTLVIDWLKVTPLQSK